LDISWCSNVKTQVCASLPPSGDSPVTQTRFEKTGHHTLRFLSVLNRFSLQCKNRSGEMPGMAPEGKPFVSPEKTFGKAL